MGCLQKMMTVFIFGDDTTVERNITRRTCRQCVTNQYITFSTGDSPFYTPIPYANFHTLHIILPLSIFV